MPRTTDHPARITRRWVAYTLAALILVAIAARLAAFLLLPNVDGDAYCYLEKAQDLRGAILAGSLRVSNLFFFWLSLYPLAVAAIAAVIPGGGHVLLVGKLLAAVSGVISCWLVFRLVFALTRRPLFALAGALVVALDPWQLLYSSNSMTEVPFEALVLGALDRLLARRWTAAAWIMVLAGFVRIEAWPLAAFIPLAAFVAERKIKVAPCLLMLAAPAAWLAISYAAKGDARAFFTIRNAYVGEFMAFHPDLAHLSASALRSDLANLRESACLPIALGAFAAVVCLVRAIARHRPLPGLPAALAIAVVYGFLLAFVAAAYLSRAQPVLWVRYGLVYEPLGVCLTLWWIAEAVSPRWRPTIAVLLIAGLVGHEMVEAIVVATRGNLQLEREAGRYLASLHPARVYCDSVVVRVESGLPHTCFRDRFDLPNDPAGFLADFHRQRLEYLVYVAEEASTPVKLFPELGAFRSADGLDPVHKIDSPDWRASVLIYRTGASPGMTIDTY